MSKRSFNEDCLKRLEDVTFKVNGEMEKNWESGIPYLCETVAILKTMLSNYENDKRQRRA